MRRCRQCKEYKIADQMPKTAFVCSQECAIAYVNRVSERNRRAAKAKQRKVDAETRAKLKTRSEWLKEAQIAFNAYIRERDKHLPCVSCLKFTNLKWNAGHYRSIGSQPALRFEPLNVWKQCEPCNSYLSGNLIEYRKELLNRIGAEKLAYLEGPHEAKKYTIDEIRSLKGCFKMMLKSLE